MKKTFKIVMLPTEKANLFLVTNKFLILNKLEYLIQEESKERAIKYSYGKFQHLYILSDDEIKEGDWCIHNNTVKQAIGDVVPFANKFSKKIVATTDKSLGITDHRISPVPNFVDMPKPNESFIQAYIKAYNEGKPITEVDLEGQYLKDESFHIHTRMDNTVIIHQSKMYTKDEVIKAYNAGYSLGYSNGLLYDMEDQQKEIDPNKWIQDNL